MDHAPFLFIGGPKDGARLSTDRDVVYFNVPRGLGDYETIRYKKMWFAGETKRFAIFVFEGVTADDVVKRLIQHYQVRQASIEGSDSENTFRKAMPSGPLRVRQNLHVQPQIAKFVMLHSGTW